MVLQMRGSQVIARRAMPKGYPRELENCNKIFLCSQTGKVEEDKGLDDSIDDKVNIFDQRGSEKELYLHSAPRTLLRTSDPVVRWST